MNILFGAILIMRLFVGAIFLFAGVVKLKRGSNRFLSAIMGYELVPNLVATVVASFLPWMEIVIGGLLILGLWSQFSALVGAMLLIIFSSGIAMSLLRNKDNDCGCFQSLTPVQWRLVYRNLLLMGLLIPIYMMKGGLWSLDNGLTTQADWQVYFSKDFAALLLIWTLALISALILHQFTKPVSQVGKT